MSEGRDGDTRIRVLTLTRDLAVETGGAERIAYEFAIRLNPALFRSYLCLTRAPEPECSLATDQDVARLQRAGVGVLRLERRNSLNVGPWLRLARFLRSQSVDIIHAHMPRASVPGTIIGRLSGVPVLINQEHGWSFEGRPLRRFLDRHIVARGDVVLAVSQYDRRGIVEVEGVPSSLVRVLPNGIDPKLDPGLDIRSSLGAASGTALIGAVGRLVPEKGHADLIKAIARLREQGRDVRCVIAGEGPQEGSLNALSQELGVHQNVRLLGPRQDVYDIIRSLDVAVLCSRNEGSPLALMEYMACAVPIVATSVGGVPEMIEDGVHGLLVKPNDPVALAAAIAKLLDHGTMARRLGSQARNRQRAEFALDAVVSRLEQLYLELFRGSRAP